MITREHIDTNSKVSECLLIKLKDNSPPTVAEQLELFVNEINGKILLELRKGEAFIVIIASMHKPMLESLPFIDFIGGVNFRPWKIKRIQVQEAPKGRSGIKYVVRNNQIIRLARG